MGTAAITARDDTSAADGVVTEPAASAAQPSGGWSRVESYFLGHDREVARIRDEEERQSALEAARAEIARVADEAKRRGAAQAASELEAVRERVAAEALAFGDFYRRLLDEAIATLQAAEAERLAVQLAQQQELDAERARVAAAVAVLEAEQAARAQDEEDFLLIMAAL